MPSEKLYVHLAHLVLAIRNCERTKNYEWRNRHTERILAAVKEHLPSGSGFDSGTTIDLDASTEEKLVFHTSFHHMDEHGSYDGWTEHDVIVKPSLAFGFSLRVTGRDRNQIKDYIHESFQYALSQAYEEKQEAKANV